MRTDSAYVLARHAFLCMVDEHYVFLDLRADKYLCLNRSNTEVLRRLLRDPSGPLSTAVWTPPGAANAGYNLLTTLVRRGLLADCEDTSEVAPRLTVPHPKSALLPIHSDAAVRSIHVRRFLLSAVRASIDLRWQGIEATIRKVANLRPMNLDSTKVEDTDLLAALTGTFQQLRHFYPRPYLCLFDSLALLYFLSYFSLFPRWVFAVKLRPFSAHCWIQMADHVVNDRLDVIAPYSPIMCV